MGGASWPFRAYLKDNTIHVMIMIMYLGHIISHEGVRVDEKNIATI